MADRVRQLHTRFGGRPYRVFLVWSRWSGEERGAGSETEVRRIELLPTPKLSTLESVTYNQRQGGIVQDGIVRLEEVSVGYTEDVLQGTMLPEPHEDSIPQPYDFYYEIVEDGRGDNPPVRRRFTLNSTPYRDAENCGWVLKLNRVGPDADR